MRKPQVKSFTTDEKGSIDVHFVDGVVLRLTHDAAMRMVEDIDNGLDQDGDIGFLVGAVKEMDREDAAVFRDRLENAVLSATVGIGYEPGKGTQNGE